MHLEEQHLDEVNKMLWKQAIWRHSERKLKEAKNIYIKEF